jgi:hypothetical protein
MIHVYRTLFVLLAAACLLGPAGCRGAGPAAGPPQAV